MPFSNVDLLVYLGILFTTVVGTLLTVVLWRVLKILGYAQRILAYADHVRDTLSHWETLPFKLLDRVFDLAMGSGTKKKK
ncbi:MAG: hypothetical protein WA194_04010 [Patescibacteria group bacterium]